MHVLLVTDHAAVTEFTVTASIPAALLDLLLPDLSPTLSSFLALCILITVINLLFSTRTICQLFPSSHMSRPPSADLENGHKREATQKPHRSHI